MKEVTCTFTIEELQIINKALGFYIDEGGYIQYTETQKAVDGCNEHVAEILADNES